MSLEILRKWNDTRLDVEASTTMPISRQLLSAMTTRGEIAQSQDAPNWKFPLRGSGACDKIAESVGFVFVA